MASYLILTPPGGTDSDHARTRFVRDGFSLLAFLFPTLWLLCHRLWLHAIAAFLLQGIGSELLRRDGLWPAGAAILLGTSLLAALEGRHAYARHLAATGWRDEGLVTAGRLAVAEDIYFADIETTTETAGDIPASDWDIPSDRRGPPPSGGAALGLIGHDGGR